MRAISSAAKRELWRMPAETHMAGEPLSPDAVTAIVSACVGDLVGSPDVVPSQRFRDDLSMDIDALYDVCSTIEDELGERTVGFVLEDDVVAELLTVQDLAEYVMGQLGIEPTA